MDYKVCLDDGCDRPARQAGRCATHWNQHRNNKKPNDPDLNPMPACSVSHCTRPANSRADDAVCARHYQKRWRGIDPETYVIPGDWVACWVEDCPREAVSYGLCKNHGRRAKQGLLAVPTELGVPLNPSCTFPGCQVPTECRGLCHSHYSQKAIGKPLTVLRDYGKYTGTERCSIPDCRRVSISGELCASHHRKLTAYGLTVDELAELCLVTQCENPGCTSTKKLSIDHDHETGTVRGVLCGSCNSALGFLYDDPERIEGLRAYLSEHRGSPRLALVA